MTWNIFKLLSSASTDQVFSAEIVESTQFENLFIKGGWASEPQADTGKNLEGWSSLVLLSCSQEAVSLA